MVAEVVGERRNGLGGIEGIGEATQGRGLGHELGDAFGAHWAHRIGLEPALLPDQAGEEIGGQVVCRRALVDRLAKRRRGRGGLGGGRIGPVRPTVRRKA